MRWGMLARAVIIAGVLASLVWAALPVARHMSGIVIVEREAPTLPVARVETARPDLAAIISFAPFGKAAQLENNTPAASSDRPDLILRGIFASAGTASTALLDVNGEPGLYRVDAPVGAAMTLVEIAADYVRLADAEGSLTLGFDWQEDAQEGDVLTVGPDTGSLFERMAQGLVIPAKYENPSEPETTSEYIDYWRQRVRRNPQTVLDEIGLRATNEGYVIAEQHDVGVRLAGLQSGDLVRTVNGQQVGDPNKDRRFYDQIAASGHARIEVERGGRILSFSFPLR